jgi:hypothetical protein
MPSPFPGVDPYVELMADWVGFHNAFMVYSSEQLNRVLPRQYVATLDAGIRFDGPDDNDGGAGGSRAGRSRRPGVVVSNQTAPPEFPPGPAGLPSVAAAASEVGAVTLLQEDPAEDEIREVFIEIVRVPDRLLVTTIELLSPSNKVPGSDDRAAYLLKRRQLLHDGVNVVDVDLLLRGERLPMLQPLPAGDFFAFVSRAQERTHCRVYPWSIRQPLPTIPIPLLPGDGPAPLALADAFSRNYDAGRYAQLIRYDKLGPPTGLSAADAAWAADIARGASTE